ncbi:MAG: hypothetical protein HYU88_05485 [Chloroflexi bacterium]|nr:hypothetical protein [Chloroflexota bacterium]MBI4505963.1 hypothetical protein [Chloroflexota bacterium]
MTVTTEEFRVLYGVVSSSLGQPALPTVFIGHPIVSVPHEEMRARAERALPAIVALATDPSERLRAEPTVRRGVRA